MNRQAQKERNDEICALFLIDETLDVIGLKYNLTRQAVGKIIKKRGLSRQGNGSALRGKKEYFFHHINGWQG